MLRSIAIALAFYGAAVNADPMTGLESMKETSAWEEGAKAASQAMQSLRSDDPPVSGIADAEMESDWRKLRAAMGIEGRDQLYVFISFSMPDSLIRAYALDAGYAGATLVVRGIDNDTDLKTFVTERLKNLMRPGEIGAPIQIDPRLFDTYQIDQVPSVVLANNADEILCEGPEKETALFQEKEVAFSRCERAKPENYWSLTGAVTTQYALEQFAKHGSEAAAPFLANLKEGFATEQPVEEGPDGETVNAVRSSVEGEEFTKRLEELAQRNAEILKERHRKTDLTLYSTPWGPAAGPSGLDMPILEESL